MLETPAVANSVAAALPLYQVPRKAPSFERRYVVLNRIRVLADSRGFRTPDVVALPHPILARLAGQGCTAAHAALSTIVSTRETTP